MWLITTPYHHIRLFSINIVTTIFPKGKDVCGGVSYMNKDFLGLDMEPNNTFKMWIGYLLS